MTSKTLEQFSCLSTVRFTLVRQRQCLHCVGIGLGVAGSYGISCLTKLLNALSSWLRKASEQLVELAICCFDP
ncbi:hypothetical protein ADL32_08025 [Streptomyces albidoflavus]|nr:hypothetical protein ADL32_08025 [Streptomyces albidoflavus]